MVNIGCIVVWRQLEDYQERKFTDWLKQWPGQAVIAIFCLFWTREAHVRGLRVDVC